jgi:hypothetical protein
MQSVAELISEEMINSLRSGGGGSNNNNNFDYDVYIGWANFYSGW